MEVRMEKKEKKRVNTPAQREAAARYLSQFVDLRVRMKPEEKKMITDYAKARGESINAMLLRLIREEMERAKNSEKQ